MQERLGKAIIVAVAAAVFGAFVGSFSRTVLAAQPQVSISNVQRFFDNYYREVPKADHRRALYQEDLTPDFRNSPGRAWPAYNRWWETQKQVVVDEVESVSGNPLEFTVWLTYYPIHGSPKTEVTSFSLVCNGRWASFMARIPTFGCPVSHLQIQSALDGTTTEG